MESQFLINAANKIVYRFIIFCCRLSLKKLYTCMCVEFPRIINTTQNSCAADYYSAILAIQQIEAPVFLLFILIWEK